MIVCEILRGCKDSAAELLVRFFPIDSNLSDKYFFVYMFLFSANVSVGAFG